MSWQWNPYMIILIIVAAVSIIIALYILSKRHNIIGASLGALILLASVEWTLGYVLELGSTNLSTKVFWNKMQYFGHVMVPLAWLIYVLKYTSREKWLTRRNLVLLIIIPLITLLLTFTNEAHNLIWTRIELVTIGSFLILSHSLEVGFWVYIVYSYILLLVATFMLIQVHIHSRHFYRWHIRALLFAVLIPWLASALQFSGFNPFWPFEIIPLAFVVSGPIWLWGSTKLRLGEIVSVSRDIVIENVSDSIVVLDVQNHIVDTNPAFQNLVGCTASEAIGKPIEQIWKDWPIQMEWSSGEAGEIYEVVKGKDYDQGIYDMRISPLTDWSGRIISRVIILRDIAERKKAEEEIKAKSKFLESLIEQSPLPTFVIDSDGICMMVNKAFLNTYNVPKKDMMLGSNALTDPANVRQDVVKYMKEALSGKIVETPEVDFISPFEDKRTVTRSRIFPILDPSNNVTNVVVMHEDITEHKKAQEALRESEERYRSLLKSSEDPIYLITKDLTYLYVNEKLLSRFGLPREEVLGREYKDFHSPEGTATFERRVQELLESGKFVRYEYKSQRDNKYFLRTLNPVFSSDNREIIAVTVVSKEITDLKKAEEQIKASLKEKEVLLREIHHRVKNNLQIMSSLLALQSEHLKDEQVIEMYKESQNRIRSMALIHEKL
ncbi:MAG: histidine kinase N-terminal 7TM domain-containing protein, partial [Candidatus Hydrothermarchaeales archaeon]